MKPTAKVAYMDCTDCADSKSQVMRCLSRGSMCLVLTKQKRSRKPVERMYVAQQNDDNDNKNNINNTNKYVTMIRIIVIM